MVNLQSHRIRAHLATVRGCSTSSGRRGDIDPATKAQVAHILEGILKNLSDKKGLVQEAEVVTKGGNTFQDQQQQQLQSSQQARKVVQSLIRMQLADDQAAGFQQAKVVLQDGIHANLCGPHALM